MKKINGIIWGALLIAAGVIFALDVLEVANVNFFFDGWWTLFIIVPCAVGLFTEREKTGNIIGIAVGVLLFLASRDIIDFDIIFKLIIPVIIVGIGIKMITESAGKSKTAEVLEEMKASGVAPKVSVAMFSGNEINYNGEVFDGAELTAVFGGIDIDLRGAIIEKDTAIKATAIFGGIDIIVPDNVNVKISSTSIFGGASNKKEEREDCVTLYVSATSIFGGVEIK
ncbi:MAG: hypothetical protein IJY23_04810 [Clostridia bacterium]|nr:hypothetical protein [Clostridia bacterium]